MGWMEQKVPRREGMERDNVSVDVSVYIHPFSGTNVHLGSTRTSQTPPPTDDDDDDGDGDGNNQRKPQDSFKPVQRRLDVGGGKE